MDDMNLRYDVYTVTAQFIKKYRCQPSESWYVNFHWEHRGDMQPAPLPHPQNKNFLQMISNLITHYRKVAYTVSM